MKVHWTAVLLLLGCVALAQSANNIKELKKQRKIFLTEVENANKLLNKNQKSIENVQNKVNLIIDQINTRERLIKNLKNEMSVLNKQIQNKETNIAHLRKNLQFKKGNYAIAIQKMHQQKNNRDQLFFILSVSDITPFFHRILYIKEYSKWIKKQGEEIIAHQNEAITEKQVLNCNVQEKTDLMNFKRSEEEKLRTQEKIRQSEVENLKRNTKKFQDEISKKKRQAEMLNREITRIIKEEIAAKKEAAKKANFKQKAKTKNTYTTTTKKKEEQTLSNEEQTLSVDFAKNKGKFLFPLKGDYRIVSRFGKQQYSNMKNIHYNSNGIDIKTTQGNTARAIFDGIVKGVFIAPGYQTCVIVRHGEYLTLYSCLEQVFVKQGEKIKTGQCVGKIYMDKENGNSTILHFELWREQVKLNPESWLRQ